MCSSWFSGICKKCGFEVVVSQSINADYVWYCSNKACSNHNGTDLLDSDGRPEWVGEQPKTGSNAPTSADSGEANTGG